MKTLDLEAIRARAAAATPGPWKIETYGTRSAWLQHAGTGSDLAHPMYVADASFIAHARTDIPALLDRIAVLERVAEAAKDYMAMGPWEPEVD